MRAFVLIAGLMVGFAGPASAWIPKSENPCLRSHKVHGKTKYYVGRHPRCANTAHFMPSAPRRVDP
jgi:hypothetical protein